MHRTYMIVSFYARPTITERYHTQHTTHTHTPSRLQTYPTHPLLQTLHLTSNSPDINPKPTFPHIQTSPAQSQLSHTYHGSTHTPHTHTHGYPATTSPTSRHSTSGKESLHLPSQTSYIHSSVKNHHVSNCM